ncbi:MAG: hypothetical protein Q9M31_09980, partial [Mariprofundus sp.]|nr:hypothetical protein [Mariprofundus sp.]
AAIGGPTLAHFRAVVCSMEPPCTSFHLKNGLKVGLPLIHPEFCNWLINKHVQLTAYSIPCLSSAVKDSKVMILQTYKNWNIELNIPV